MRARRLAAALLAIGCASAVAGCSAAYTGERLFWKARQLAEPIAKQPHEAAPEQIAKAIEAFERVIDKAPGTVWAARSQAAIGSLHSLNTDYPRAREAYTLVLQNYSQYRDMVLASRAAIAKSYELEDKWDDAVKAYQDLGERHRWTRLGLEAPLYVAAIYEKRGDAAMATRAYERAVRAYTLMIPDAPSEALEVQASGYLVSAYQRLNDWPQAIALLETLLSSPSANHAMVLLSLGMIYQTKLSQPEKAGELYTRLLTEFPDHPLGRVAQAQLSRLQPSGQVAGVTTPSLGALAPAPHASPPAQPLAP